MITGENITKINTNYTFQEAPLKLFPIFHRNIIMKIHNTLSTPSLLILILMDIYEALIAKAILGLAFSHDTEILLINLNPSDRLTNSVM